MKRLIVGGNFGAEPKKSGVVTILGDRLFANKYNGGSITDLNNHRKDIKNFDLILWMPNVSNEEEKIYPEKRIGTTLIVSKVLRGNTDAHIGEAISRIFKMSANAVIAIDTSESTYKFILIDALGNTWASTTDLVELSKAIEDFYLWTANAVRIGTVKISDDPKHTPDYIDDFCKVIKRVSEKVENERGGRYFGNASTRCEKTFPSMKSSNETIFVSKRNISKKHILPDDFVCVMNSSKYVLYNGPDKPSVDTPIQLSLYEAYPNIKFMIHGHAHIKYAQETGHYFPCGDMRELGEIIDRLPRNPSTFVLNLKNHGFLIGTSTIEELKNIVEDIEFSFNIK